MALSVIEPRQLYRLLELAHEGIIVRDPVRSTVTYWSRGAQRMYGYSAAEARGQVTHDLLQTEFPSSREAVDEALIAEGRWDGELWHTCKNGARILVSSRQALVSDDAGAPNAVVELNTDVTEQRAAEQALIQAEQRFRGLVETAPDATVIIDASGTITLINARAEALFGYDRAEIVGRPFRALLSGRDRDVLAPGDSLADLTTRAVGQGHELHARRRDGGEFLAEISFSEIPTDEETLVCASVRDISRQLLRQLESALVPGMRIDERWRVAWRYRPTGTTMLLGGDFIGVADRADDGSLALAIGDVTGHGPSAAGTGAMLRAAWLGAVQAGVEMEQIMPTLNRLLVDQAHRDLGTLATVCLVEIDRSGRRARLVRAGHDSPLLIGVDGASALATTHGPALGLVQSARWPLQTVGLPSEAALMLFTDGLTERRTHLNRDQIGFDELLAEIDTDTILRQSPEQALDSMLQRLFPHGTETLTDDLAVILVHLGRPDALPLPGVSRAA